jgi:biotin carboxylase
VKQLGEVIANPVALKRLEAQPTDLAKAFAEVDTREKRFEEALVKAYKNAEEAQQLVDAYDGDAALMEYATRLGRIGQVLIRTMKGTPPQDAAGASE